MTFNPIHKVRMRALEYIHGRRIHDVGRIEGLEYTDDPDIQSLVFICGLHRSGTTLLERLLTARFEISYLRATVPESEGQHMQEVFSPASKFSGPGLFAFSRAMREELEAQTDYAAYGPRILDEWRKYVIGTAPVLLEKSPPHLTKIWWLRKVFPGSRFIIMARDPRAVSGATQKWSKTSLPELMMHWNAAYSTAMEDFSEEDCIITRYEDLMETPEEEIARLGAFLSLAPRARTGSVETRFSDLRNSNPKYFEAHNGTVYGRGVWDSFGYTV
tara:strand:+ start:2677 stop:3495 length:819 start_codon:yes stop_codon:yes gene_type:complete